MRSLIVLASVVVIAASAANCADVPGEANSIGSIAPSVLAAPPSIGATLTVTATGGKKGKPGAADPTPDLAYRMVIDDGNGVPNYGETIAIDVLTAQTWNQIDVTCYQNGVAVFGSARTVDYQYPIRLQSAVWTGGAADCTADLIAWGQKAPIASLPITVLE